MRPTAANTVLSASTGEAGCRCVGYRVMNLIVCATPFQVLMAEKIIDCFPERDFFGVMLVSADNAKYRRYAARLLEKCGGRGFVYVQQKARRRWLALWDLLVLKHKGRSLEKMEAVYVASFDSVAVQTLLSGVYFGGLYSFDDGTANLVHDSYYYSVDRHQGFAWRLLKKLTGNPYDLAALKARSLLHFTAYRAKNVMPNIRYLPLFADPPQEQADNAATETETVSVLLGQPVYELAEGLTAAETCRRNIALAECIVQTFGIDFYFPHPRETYRIDGVSYLDSEWVAEDFFAAYFRPDRHYRLYTLCSGAVLPFVGMHNVSVVSIRPDDCPPKAAEGYRLMEQMGIPVFSLPQA